MSDPRAPSPTSLLDNLFRWSSDRTRGALVALLVAFVVLALQITLLGGWRLGVPEPRIALAPVNAAVTVNQATPSRLTFNFLGAPAVSASKTISVAANQALGIRASFDYVPENARMMLGWVSTRDRRKPTNLALALPASNVPITYELRLAGHPEWRDGVSQFALMLAAQPGTPPVTVSDVEWISATPAAAARHTFLMWGGSERLLRVDGIAIRVLPLSVWMLLAGALAFFAVTRFGAPKSNVAAERGMGALTAFAVLLAPFAIVSISQWQLNAQAAGSITAAVALLLALLPAASAALMRFTLRLNALALIASLLAVVIAGLSFAWAPVAVCAAIALRANATWAQNAVAGIVLVPMIALGALAHAIAAKFIAPPAGFAVIDPSASLVRLLASGSVFVALIAACGFFVLLLPNRVAFKRYDAASALWLAVVGIVAALCVGIASDATPPTTRNFFAPDFALWWLPIAVCFMLAVTPTLREAWTQSGEIAATHEKSEHELSDVVRQLFDGANESFQSAINEGRTGNALGPLNRMKEIAPGSLRTKAAEVNYALRGTQLAPAKAAFLSLLAAPRDTLDAETIALAFAYANRTRDYANVIALAQQLPATEENARLHARAVMLSATADAGAIKAARTQALEILASVPKPNALAHEIAELHLYANDWQAAQQSLAESSIAPQSLPGQIYVARLGLHATDGSAQYADQVKKFATWNADLELAHLAMGELLLREGNHVGARARFALVGKQDITLWIAERRVHDIDHAIESAKQVDGSGRAGA